jgi:hypothetical protein
MNSLGEVRSIALLALCALCSCVTEPAADPIILPDGLVAYYPFKGNTDDKSGQGHNGTVVGATLTKDRFGNDNGAYSFNGVTNYVRCGDILDDVFCAPVAKFTVAGWARTRTMGTFTGGGGLIVGKNGGGTNGPFQWNVNHSDGLVYAAVMTDPLAQNYVAVTSPMPANQWFHFVLIFDGSLPKDQRLQLYVNGVSVNTRVFADVGTFGTSTTNTAQELTIGSGHRANAPQSPNNCYDGDIDEIRIYNRALLPAEQLQLYTAK